MASPCALLCVILFVAIVSRVAVSVLECPEENVIDESFRSTPSDIVHLLVTDSADDAKYTALCHIACINYATEDADSMNGTQIPSELGPGMLQYDCNQLKQYLDCRTGCIAQSKGLTNCSNACSGRCIDVCGSFLGCFGLQFDGNPCGIGCKETDCSEGCQQFSEFPNTTLPKPTATPELTQMNSLGIYDVSIPSELDPFLEDKPSLVYRIETQPGQYVYQWKVEIDFGLPVVNLTEFLIDLKPYSGTTVNVSFAYATLSGLSAYSDPTEIGLFREVVPVSPSDSVHRIVTDSQDKAENGGFCHSTCLALVLADMPTNENSSSEMENPIMTDNETMDGFNCDQLKKYLDCRTGCIAQSMGETNCADTCSRRCLALCGAPPGFICFPFDGNRCGAGCNRDDCDEGCQKFIQMTSDRLAAPMAPPQLQRMPQNIYSLDLPTDSEMGLFSTSSPVFRIQTESDEQYYQWMVDIEFSSSVLPVFITENLLDLSAFTGRRLSIAYAFATDMGISEYSQNVVVQVPKQCIAVPLTTDQVQIESRRDEREGFFAHSVLDVSWCPTPCVQEVSHYIITRNPICSDPVTETVNASTSSVVLMSNSPPTSFNLPCSQTVQVQTVLIDGTTQEVTERISLPRVSGDGSIPHPESLGCPIMFDSERQQYQVDFEFRLPFSPAALSHIQALVIRVDKFLRLEGGLNHRTFIVEVGVDQAIINASVDQIVYEYTTYVDPGKEEGIFYRITVEVGWMRPLGPLRSTNCATTDAAAPPPFPIDDVTIIERNTRTVSPNSDGRTRDIEVSVRVRWSQPQLQLTLVPITKYEVYVGRRELSPAEDPRGTITVDVTQFDDERLSKLPLLEQDFEGLEFEDLRTSEQTLTAYVQIRSFQYDDFPSNWSIAEEVVFVILGPQLRVPSLVIEFDTVRVEYEGNDTRLELSGEATWSQPDVDPGVRVESYQLEIESNTVAITTTYDELLTTNAAFSNVFMLSNEFTLDVTFTVTYNATLLGEDRRSIPRSVTQQFRPLSFPENIVVTSTCLVGDRTSSKLSLELSISWEHPQTEGDISSYDIYFSTGDNILRHFDFFGNSDETLRVPGHLTRFTGNFSVTFTDINPANPLPPQPIVQMRSIKDDSVNLLPQWSEPITVSLEDLQPPVITDSDITSITLSRGPGPGLFTISTEGMLSWKDNGEAETYEVWVGSRPLLVFDEPDDMYGDLYKVDRRVVASESSPNNTNNSSSEPDENFISINVCATFSSDSDKGIVYIQIRAFDRYCIPLWSIPALSFLPPTASPPVDNVTDVRSGLSSLTFTSSGTRNIPVTILDDEIVGASEFFIVSLFNAQPSTVVLIPDTITVTIRDNDDVTVTPPTRQVNYTIVGDPLYTAPVQVSGSEFGLNPSTVVSLCYEIHGEANQLFNIVNDVCTLVNAHYSRPNPAVDVNIIDVISVRAVDSDSECHNISLTLEECSVTVDGVETERCDRNGITVRHYIDQSRVRVSVPNCGSQTLVMWMFCETGSVVAQDGVIEMDMIKFVIARGIGLSRSSHGLVGQMWNVRISVSDYTGDLGVLDPNDAIYYVNIPNTRPIEPTTRRSRTFVAVLQKRSWDRSRGPCLYAGNRQAGPTGDIPKDVLPNDPVIEGEYKHYIVSGKYSADCVFCTEFDESQCGV